MHGEDKAVRHGGSRGTSKRITHVRTKELGRFQQSESVLRALIESPQRLVIFALDREYRYLAFNQAHARTMRQLWDVDIEVGANMLELIGREDDRAKAKSSFDRALSGESFTLVEEYGCTSKERRIYENVYSPVRGEGGSITGLALYLRDVTEQQRAELELRRYRNHLEELVAQRSRELQAAHEQLLHAQKLESLGVLAGGIAHDFNNLLSIVLARSELCQRDVARGVDVRGHLEIIRDTALEARLLTRQLLGYAGKGRFLIQTLCLSEVISGVFPLLRASVSKAITIRRRAHHEAVPVKADATQLRQVLLNLVSNAAEAIGSSGTIEVSSDIQNITPAQCSNPSVGEPLAPGSYACLRVSDTGCGISEEIRTKLFDPFFTTKLSGRGLGLAAVLGIVKSHSGTLQLRSTPGVGSEFRILLPLANADELADASPASAPRQRQGRRKGLALVVDDETAVRAVTSEFLRHAGYRVLEASGGQQACQLLRQHGPEVNVVLLDWAMPIMNGEQTLRALRSICPRVRVILLTGYAEEECRARFRPGELSGFISKPFAQEELLDAVEAIA